MFSADILLRLNLQYIHSKNQSLENIFKEKEWGGNDLAGLQSGMEEKTHSLIPREPRSHQCWVTLWRKGIWYTYCDYVDIVSSKALEGKDFHSCFIDQAYVTQRCEMA